MVEACVTETALFRNEDWLVTAEGIEHARTGYFVGTDLLGARREAGLWDWPLQVMEKSWCRPSLFREAFLAALHHAGVAADADLARSFALGIGLRGASAPGDGGFVALGELLRRSAHRRAGRPVFAAPASRRALAGA